MRKFPFPNCQIGASAAPPPLLIYLNSTSHILRTHGRQVTLSATTTSPRSFVNTSKPPLVICLWMRRQETFHYGGSYLPYLWMSEVWRKWNG